MKLLMIMSLMALISITSNESVEISEELVKVNFTPKTEFNDLVKIKLDLSEQGIKLQYKKIVFDKYDDLVEISFEVDCNDGFKGGASSSRLTNQSKFGFIRDYKGNVPFATGDLSKYD